jgi:hypothetical protein
MSRLVFRPVLVVLTLALIACSAARGQRVPGDEDPLDKARARAVREGHPDRTQALGQALRGTAQAVCSIRLNRFRVGADYPDLVLEDLGKLLTADLALANTPAERRAAWGRHWAGCLEVELLLLHHVEAGIRNFTIADYWAARTERLLAASLVAEIGRAGQPAPGSLHSALDDADSLDSRAPRDEFEMTRAEPRRLGRAARDACENEYAVRSRRLTAGSDTPNHLLPLGARRLAAARAAGENPEEYLAAVETLWLRSWNIEQLTRERVESGIKAFSSADVYEARDRRLETSALLAKARRGAGMPLPLQGSLQASLLDGDPDPLNTRDVARAKAEATRADIADLNRQRREAILTEYAARIQRVRDGTDTPDVTSAASRRLCDVELALASGKAGRLAALERKWAQAAEIERFARKRMEAGIRQFTWANVLDARYDRILAELRLAEARGAKE